MPIESGTTSISWDGSVIPCWPLRHNHISCLHGKEHRTKRHVIGNVNERDLVVAGRDPVSLNFIEKEVNFGIRRKSFSSAPAIRAALKWQKPL